ncbi:hypothetical protein RJC98_05345 [Pseudomonas allii]|uniref:Uncharacterized protein n=1 Tax=Pseudomonas allii TaxID=2740531 RepID=A0ACC6L8J9_9PSED|nr:hypothetical protein [Pseudomonas allii]MDR9874592.1 hypothetical protein [Pseudomonas allii]
MRYLKATARDMCGNGQPDTVILHFYQHQAGCPDVLMHEMIALDMTADSKVDVQWAGHNEPDTLDLDKRTLAAFANSFLALNWFNPACHLRRSLTLYVDHLGKTGRPNAVKLEFHERTAKGHVTSLMFKAASYDGDSDGVLESFTNSDIDRDGVADKADKELIRSICTAFLALNWHDL